MCSKIWCENHKLRIKNYWKSRIWLILYVRYHFKRAWKWLRSWFKWKWYSTQKRKVSNTVIITKNKISVFSFHFLFFLFTTLNITFHFYISFYLFWFYCLSRNLITLIALYFFTVQAVCCSAIPGYPKDTGRFLFATQCPLKKTSRRK